MRDVRASSSRITESNLGSVKLKKSVLCTSNSPLLWTQWGIGYAFEYVKMLSCEHLWAGFPLVNENGPGLGIGLVKDGVVVVIAILLSTKAIVLVLIFSAKRLADVFLVVVATVLCCWTPNSNFPLYLSKLTKDLFIACYRKGFRRSVEGSNASAPRMETETTNIYVLSRNKKEEKAHT